jgi:hypothetical protein
LTHGGQATWHGHKPDVADYEALAKELDEYIDMFSEDFGQEQGQSMA